jgi:hypothetical protein
VAHAGSSFNVATMQGEHSVMYEVFFEMGTFDGPNGADKLAKLLAAHSENGKKKIVSVVPLTMDGRTQSVQIIVAPERR